MTKIIRAADEAAFLGLVPTLAAHQPSQSLILVVFEGNRTIAALRFDDTSLERVDVITRRLAEALAGNAPTADSIAIVGYTDRPEAGTELSELGEILRRNWHIKGVFHVGTVHWLSLLPDVDAGGLTAEIPVPEGIPAPVATKTAGAVLPTLTEGRRDAIIERYAGLVEPSEIPDHYLDALSDAVPFLDGYGDRPEFERIFIGQASFAGDGTELTAMYELAKEVAAAFPESWIAHLGASWAAWAIGRGSWAGVHVAEAQRLAPERADTADLFLTLLRAGYLPEWATARPAHID